MKPYLFFALLLLACTQAFAKTQKTAVPVMVRIRNSSTADIKRIVLTNSMQDTFQFSGIKSKKTSAARKLSSLCSCQYTLDITYIINKKEVKITRNCVNIRACDDFFKGKYLIDIVAPRKDKPAEDNVNLTFTQQ